MVLSDGSGRVEYLNSAAETLTGWPLAEAFGRRTREVLCMESPIPDNAQREEGCLGLQAIATTEPAHQEAWVVSRDGRRTPVELTCSLLKMGDGPVKSMVRIRGDLADRQRNSGSADPAGLRFQNLAEGSQDILFTLSRLGRVTALNPAFDRITGFTSAERLDCPFPDLVAPEDHEACREALRSALTGHSCAPLELRIPTRGGAEAVVECSFSPILEAGRVLGVWGVARDITQRKRLEERAVRAQKMEAVMRVAGGIAHDFNNLLTAINGYADFLRQSLSAGNPLHVNVDGILSSASRAADLSRRLLAFSRDRHNEPRRVDLNAFLRNLLPTLEGSLEDGIRLEADLAEGLDPVQADPSELEQTLHILVTNAREAMPRGGRLILRTAWSDPSPGGASPADRTVALIVADTGRGMSDAVKSRLFEPFFTTKPMGRGLGLGLSSVYGYMKRAGGDIQVESAPGRGTLFRLAFLPAAPETAGLPETSAKAPWGGETVLLVEDDEEVRFLLGSILKADGYAVLEARDGEHALELAAGHRGHLHLVLTDLHMPRLGGRGLAEELMPRHPGLKVLFMSGYSEEDFPPLDGGEGRVGFLQKPFMPKSLLRQIRRVLDA
ncbi:MAG TPA: PAS domain S-box protein [Fibrobacteria bacterium]|nr:PAS domain S-box protein [Fibrobacteria bacterium]